MAASREEIEKALEWAKSNNDEAAIRGLNEMLNSLPAEGALPPEGYVPGETSALIEAQSDPMPAPELGQRPALSSEADIDAQLEQRQALAREQKKQQVESEKPWGERTQTFFDKVREGMEEQEALKWDKAQKQFDADQTLLADPANVPTQKEIDDWIGNQQIGALPSVGQVEPVGALLTKPIVNTEGKQVLRDPETGRLRWAALPPAVLYGEDKEKPSLGGMLTGAIASETVNAIGRRVEDIEANEQGIETFQKYIVNSLPAAERERVRNELADHYGVDPSKITDEAMSTRVQPNVLKGIIDQNEANQSIYDDIRAEEGGALERARRAGSKLVKWADTGLSYAAEVVAPAWVDPAIEARRERVLEESNVFGAETPEAPVFAADTPLGYWLGEWEKRAASEGAGLNQSMYRMVAEPFKQFDPDLELGTTLRYASEKMQEKAYGEEYERIKRPLLKPGTELTWEDMTNPETYTSPEAAILDPVAMAVKTAEQLPNMGPGVAGSFVGGKLSSRMFRGVGGQLSGRGLQMSIREVEKAARKKAFAGGVGGNFLANSIVYDHVASEIRDTMSMVPDEILVNNEKIKFLMAAGLTFEEAKQLTVQEAASSAGRGAWAGSTVLSTPTAGMAGLGGGGTLLARSRTASAVGALGLSGVEEAAQELYEGWESDVKIEQLDPENPVLKDKGRFAERAFGGLTMGITAGGPLEVAAAVQRPLPGGIDQETQDAAQKTMDFIDARNERFAQELKVSDPKYIERTAGVRRLEQLEKLQSLQMKEADAILDMEAPLRQYLENNAVAGAEVDLAMLDSLVTFANSQKTDIAVAKSQRMTAKQMLEYEDALMQERADLQRRVNERLINLEDIKRLQNSLTLAQEQEPMTMKDLDELIENEYVVTVGESNRPIITPKGRRALKNLGLQRLNLETALNQGFTGQERRSPENLARRDQIDRMSAEDKEALLYEDAATGVQNLRAFKERGQDTEAMAVMEADSIEWVNDEMTFAAGDRMLSRIAGSVADAVQQTIARGIQEMGGDELDQIQLYRISGKEFALTGPNQGVLERILQQTKKELSEDTITDGRTDVTPSVTWGKGNTQAEAEKDMEAQRKRRINEGTISPRKERPTTAKGRKKPQGRLRLDTEFVETVMKHDDTAGAAAMKTQAEAEYDMAFDSLDQGSQNAINNNAPRGVSGGAALRHYLENPEGVYWRKFASERAPGEKRGDGRNWRHKEEVTKEEAAKRRLQEAQAALAEVRSQQDVLKAQAEADMEQVNVAHYWEDIGIGDSWATVEIGDVVEIVTPARAQFGTITRVWGGARRPRVEVQVDGRRFRFNPDRNWLINNPVSSPEDIAWITNDQTMLDPNNIPQVLEEVQIGFMGKGGDAWYADLATELVTDQMNIKEFMDKTYEPKYHLLPVATPEERNRAQAVKDDIDSRFANAPPINLVNDIELFRIDEQELYQQILSEVRASGGTSIRSVRGYYDPLHPESGVYVFTANVARVSGLDGTAFEQLVQETIFHEVVGHYGIRALFRNEVELEAMMFELVDAFNTGPNSLARRMEAQLNLYGATSKDFDPARKLLLGEEMVAYTVGLEMSNQLDLSPEQKGIIRRILDWIRGWLNRFFGQYNDKFVSLTEQRREFWNDDRVRDLVSRATDFVRRGPPYKKTQYDHGRTPFMRDGDIFQWNIQQILRTATRKLSNADRKQLKQKYGGDINNVPKEVPIFPQTGTVKQYKNSVLTISRPNNPWGVKKFELEALGMDPNAKEDEWYLFRDLTYGNLLQLHGKSQNRITSDVDRDWYKQYMPGNLVQELDGIFEALDKLSITGPLPKLAGEHDRFLLDYSEYLQQKQYQSIRPITNETSYRAMQSRINEILDMKIGPNTKLNWDVIEQHFQSSRAFQVYAEGNDGSRRLSDGEAANLLWNGSPESGNWLYEDGRNGLQDATDEERAMMEEAKRLARARGVDIGFNPDTGQWHDDPRSYSGSWTEYVPAGSLVREDYRIHLIKTRGGPFPEMPQHRDHFSPNFLHIRTSVAELAKLPEGFDAANQKYANRALMIIEKQTDWGTNWRSGFESEAQMREADARGKQFYAALENAYKEGAQRADRILVDTITHLIEPLMVVMPDSDSNNEPLVRQAQEEMEARSVERYAKPLASLTPSETQELWHLMWMERHDKFIESMNNSIEVLDNYLRENEVELDGTTMRSLDVRLFDTLDQFAANNFLKQIRKAMDNVTREIVQRNNPARETTTSLRRVIAALVDHSRWRHSNEKANLRLPWVKDKVGAVMKSVLEPIGANSEMIDKLMNTFTRQTQTQYTMSKEALVNIFNAGMVKKLGEGNYRRSRVRRFEDANPHFVMARRIFKEYAKTDFFKNIETRNGPDTQAMAVLAGAPLDFQFDTTDPDNLGISVSGSPEALVIFDKYKDDLIEDYIRKMVPLNIASVKENEGHQNNDVQDLYDMFSRDWITNHDLRHYLSDYSPQEPDIWLDNDVDGSDRGLLDNNGVNHFNDFVDEHESEAEEIARDRRDWDSIHDEEGRNEENPEYQRLLDEEGEEAANNWLAEEKSDAELEWENTGEFVDEVRDIVREIVESRLEGENPPYLFISDLPVEWDEDGDVTRTVEFKITADDIGSNYYVHIDDDWKDYFYSEDEAWESANNVIANYFRSERIRPPVGEIMGPANDAEVAEVEELSKGKVKLPNLDILSKMSRGQYVPKQSNYVDLFKAFKQMVEIDKKFKYHPATEDDRSNWIDRYYPPTPLANDKYWRVMGLRYILADAVRRGFGAVVWQEGLASSRRGGTEMGNEDRIALTRLDWTQEVIEVGGKPVEAFVIDGPELGTPVVVTEQNMVQVMGLQMSAVMKQQAAGRWTPPGEKGIGRNPVIKLPYTVEELRNKSHYVINEVVSDVNGRVSYGVHDVMEGRFVGFYATEAEAQAVIDQEGVSEYSQDYFKRIERRIEAISKREEAGAESRTVTRDPIGEKQVANGVIYPEDIGAMSLFVIPGHSVYDYQHTWAMPKLAGARMNYEKMTLDAWNKELKQYGAKVEQVLIKLPDNQQNRAYHSEGQRGRVVARKGEKFGMEYGDTEIVEVSEPNPGFVIMTEKKGPIDGRIFNSYDDALKKLERIKEDQRTQMEGVEAYVIVLNDEIKNRFSKPIAAFQRDDRLEEGLKTARSKIKERTKGSLADRFREFRTRSRMAWQHKYVDMLYGLRESLERTEMPDTSYMAARVAIAGLEARVKSALYYGWPTWDEDTTSYAGKGLMEVWSGIATDPRLWGEYMLGLRGRELMMEGFDNLSAERQTAIAQLVSNLDGETTKEKIWSYVVAKVKDEVVNTEGAYNLTAEERAELGEIGAQFYDNNLYHFRRRGTPGLLPDGRKDPIFHIPASKLKEWEKKKTRNGPVIDMRVGPLAEEKVSIETGTGRKKSREEIGVYDDPDMTKWERKKRNMVWTLMDDPRIVDKDGNILNPAKQEKVPGRYSKWEQHVYYGVESVEEAERIIDAVQDMALRKEALKLMSEQELRDNDFSFEIWENGREKTFSMLELAALIDLGRQYPQFDRIQKEFANWWSHLLDFCQEAGIINPETRPFWESEFYLPLFRIIDDRIGGAFGTNSGIHPNKPIKRLGGQAPKEKRAQLIHHVMHGAPDERRVVALKDKFGKKVVDQAIKEGLIEIIPPSPALLEQAKGKTDKGGVSRKARIATRILKGLENNPSVQNTDAGREHLIAMGNNVGDPIDNILMNMVRLIDAATQNHWKKMAIDDLIETGEIKKSPIATDTKMVPMSEIVKILKKADFNVDSLPPGFAQSLQKVTALNPLSEKDGYISIFRDGKREYYTTDNKMLYESITLINRKNFHENWAWLTLPKRFYTGTITLAPPFMATNAFRDTISASISGRDHILPFIDSMKGFVHALANDETMRTMTSGGASFEAGYITGGDSRATAHMVEKAIAKADFQRTILDNPAKLAKVWLLLAADSYMKVGSSFENASRVALFKAARAAGKSKLRSLYEGLDIMDFSMRGNSAAIQWLCAVVPFMNARIQGLYRTGRGFKENPKATLLKGGLYTFAALSLWAMFRDDERYKELQPWDKAIYHHFWIGDEHFRLPRAFEVGALFTTIPEAWAEALYSDAPDYEKDLIRMHLFVMGEAFAFNPIAQGGRPIVEMMANYNFFTQRQIVSPYDQRMAEDQFGPRTSPTMRELAKFMPDIDIGKGNTASPKHLENLYRGYTGTLGKYLLDASDWLVRQSLDYPLPPTRTPGQHWLTGRFYLGTAPTRNTKQQEEFYRMMEKLTAIQQSVAFYERTGIDDPRWDEILETEAAYINVADELEDIREDIRELNREEMEIEYEMLHVPEGQSKTPEMVKKFRDEKREMIDMIVRDRNELFNEAYKLRPGGEYNPLDEPAKSESLINLIYEWGVNDSDAAKRRLKEESPATLEVLDNIKERMELRHLKTLARISAANEEQ